MVTRRWRKGDTIELELPFTSRTVPIEERAAQVVASMRGPIMLAAVNPPDELTATAAALARMEPVPGKPLEFDCRTGTGRCGCAVLSGSARAVQHLLSPHRSVSATSRIAMDYYGLDEIRASAPVRLFCDGPATMVRGREAHDPGHSGCD